MDLVKINFPKYISNLPGFKNLAGFEPGSYLEPNPNQIEFRIEYPLPVKYKGIHLDCGYRLDLLVEDEIILELKTVERLKGIHAAQLFDLYEAGEHQTRLPDQL